MVYVCGGFDFSVKLSVFCVNFNHGCCKSVPLGKADLLLLPKVHLQFAIKFSFVQIIQERKGSSLWSGLVLCFPACKEKQALEFDDYQWSMDLVPGDFSHLGQKDVDHCKMSAA